MLDIVLSAVGLLIIGASYVISEKKENGLLEKKAEEYVQIKDVWTQKEEEIVRKRIDSIVEDRVEQAIDRTDDELSRISNEKIMSTHEFSDQVLEKISRNHEEVVFLYNMLNEKEKQIKTAIQEIDVWQSNMEKAMEAQKMEAPSMASNDTMAIKAEDMEPASDRARKEPAALPPEEAGKTLEALQETLSEKEKEKFSIEKTLSAEEKMTTEGKKPAEGDLPETTPEEAITETGKSRNEEILNLYKEGKSVLEISKAFGMGQGEVSLIIHLFQGART